jgi:MtrB/PioB family decaheme-associated outer membrane protein
MKLRGRLSISACAVALLIGVGPMVPGALAAEMPTKAKVWTAGAPPLDGWWFNGEAEAGGRFFLNNPNRNGNVATGQHSLAKYYEYSDTRPGPFGNLRFQAGSNNGLYGIDFLAKNIGYQDQKYALDLSKAGEHYVSLGWDQTPHVYSTSALTIFNGVGTNALTVPASVANLLNTDRNNATNINTDIRNNLHQTDIGIRRDTASVQYRWTPTDAWDVKVDYTNMHRTGTMVDAVPLSSSSNATAAANRTQVVPQVPAPVDDTTQTYGLSGEYAGMSPWNKKFNLKLAYNGSTYRDAFDSYTVQDPFCDSAGANCPSSGGITAAPVGRMSLWPNNQANAFSATAGADLPFKSRYMSTIAYTMMRQNDAFLPFSNNPASSTNSTPPAFGLPAASLNGATNTLLSNHVLTTQITPELKSKLSYRYYNYDDQTPRIFFPNGFVRNDAGGAGAVDFDNIYSVRPSYIKQNVGAELNWRPSRQWNLGAAYGYEHYDWTYADVDKTNEHSGKVFADWQAATWAMVRVSYMAAARRYDNYNHVQFLGQFNDPLGDALPNPAYRQFMYSNRDRQVAKVSMPIVVVPRVTVTPFGGLRYDNYPNTDGLIQQFGLIYDNSWNAGAEISYVMNPDTTFLASYTRENYAKQIWQSATLVTNIRDHVDTVTLAVNYMAIPNKLDLSLQLVSSWATDSYDTPGIPGGFPDIKTSYQRLDAMAKYKFDPTTVQMLGWKGDVWAKFRYAVERNSVANWQNDMMDVYMASVDPASGRMIFLAYDNPNYLVHFLAASLVFKW